MCTCLDFLEQIFPNMFEELKEIYANENFPLQQVDLGRGPPRAGMRVLLHWYCIYTTVPTVWNRQKHASMLNL